MNSTFMCHWTAPGAIAIRFNSGIQYYCAALEIFTLLLVTLTAEVSGEVDEGICN